VYVVWGGRGRCEISQAWRAWL